MRPLPRPGQSVVAWNNVPTDAEKLVKALDQLDNAEGLRRLSAGWRPMIREKARITLKEARTALAEIEVQLRNFDDNTAPQSHRSGPIQPGASISVQTAMTPPRR